MKLVRNLEGKCKKIAWEFVHECRIKLERDILPIWNIYFELIAAKSILSDSAMAGGAGK